MMAGEGKLHLVQLRVSLEREKQRGIRNSACPGTQFVCDPALDIFSLVDELRCQEAGEKEKEREMERDRAEEKIRRFEFKRSR